MKLIKRCERCRSREDLDDIEVVDHRSFFDGMVCGDNVSKETCQCGGRIIWKKVEE